MQLNDLKLDDKYTIESGPIYLSGVQALVRLLMLQRQRDLANGLNTAGFVSGYRGSPLGGVDQQLWKARQYLEANHVRFQPGLNEDLAATSVWGTQQVGLYPGAKYDGVFGMWYGKGPGVDRSLDALKHANAAGTSQHGGVIVVCGDDHGAKSSSLPHQSEHVLKAACIPVFFPSTVQEYLDMGIHAYAMSRYAGVWVGFKVVTDVVEASASVWLDPQRVQPIIPTDFILPADGLNIRWPDTGLAQEARLLDYKLYAALAYARANKLNQIVIDSPQPRLGILTAGKAYLDVRQALDDLGLSEEICSAIGLRVMKVGMTWPLDAHDVRHFAKGVEEILVVEEKRQLLEYQIKEELYNWEEAARPRVFGKFDDDENKEGGEWSIPQGNWLLPAHAELSPALIAKALARRLEKFSLPSAIRERIAARIQVIEAREKSLATLEVNTYRQPWYCSGCPHNSSTVVPEGSRGLAGIGCHYMVMWMDRNTTTITQMGAEGTPWIGQAPFTEEKHVFANLGDGTYFHSGILAIRAAVAAKVSITYKILYNDAVAMTGGQPVDGSLSVPQLVQQVAAEGVQKIVIVTDEPEKYAAVDLGVGIEIPIHHRDELDTVQKTLRDYVGVSALIYDQTCAAEKRRRRKKNTPEKIVFPDPPKRVFINDAVCEGCGDCSTQSNCLSVEPLETEFGRKRTINQSSCNKDYSCVKGFCPSFVTVHGGKVRKAKGVESAAHAWPTLPTPTLVNLDESGGYAYYKYAYGILITGIGGTGVVTIGQLLGMAAHLEGKGCSVLDMAGLAQKGGSVYSHVQIASTPAHLYATRIATGDADVIIGCDLVVTGSAESLAKMQQGRTHVVANTGETPTASFVNNPDWQFPAESLEAQIQTTCGAENVALVDATHLATALMGDAIYTNPFLLGFAWQKGWIPLSEAALLRAIELNGTAIAQNQQAFQWGRYAAHDLAAVQRIASPSQIIALPASKKTNLDALLASRTAHLTAYQNAAYAKRYLDLVDTVREVEEKLGSQALTLAVARYYAKLLAYKDEYEVARLYTDPSFTAKLAAQFEGDFQLSVHLAPPLWASVDKESGHPRKQPYGPWMFTAFAMLAKLKGLRGTPLDIFGYSAERQMERALITQYEADIAQLLRDLTAEKLPLAIQIASVPEGIRGYGHVKARHHAQAESKRQRLWAEWQGK